MYLKLLEMVLYAVWYISDKENNINWAKIDTTPPASKP